MLRSIFAILSVALFALPAFAQDEIPDEADAVLAKLQDDYREASQKFDQQVRALTEKTVSELQKIQDKLTKEGKLDDALALRERIRLLKAGGILAHDDPGTLTEYGDRIGSFLFFRITGATDGKIFGTGVYTADSPLATAAVHAGVVKYGETAVVKVTILPGRNSYRTSDQNEIISEEWGTYDLSYRVEALPALAPPPAPMPEPAPMPKRPLPQDPPPAKK